MAYPRSTREVSMLINALASGLTVSVRSPPVVLATGIRSMPQIGQSPGLVFRICGCIEQVHIEGPSTASVASPALDGVAGFASLELPIMDAST